MKFKFSLLAKINIGSMRHLVFLKETSEKHQTNFVILKNLKGGLNKNE